jgi:inner membrane protein
MPSPIGHALAGVAVAWSADVMDRHRSSAEFAAVCAGLAMLPDADLLVPGAHRIATHSLFAAALVFSIAIVVTGKVTRTAVVCGLAYASHLLLDWLGADNFPPRGIELLWPFSHTWYISDLDVFRQTARQHFLTAPIIGQNLIAVAQELAILTPLVAALWWLRRRA